jgi:hypothetical protein
MKGETMQQLTASLIAALAGVALAASPAVAQDDETSTDSLGDQKGADRVDASESKVDRTNSNTFEKDRFFIDKIDTAETEEKTLFQGNLISSTFFYNESGGQADGNAGTGGGGANSKYSRMFTDLRLQLDARHIRGGRWLARADVRGRGVPGGTKPSGYAGTETSKIQSGLTGESELEVKELWVARPGDRTDLFIGRQTIADLGAVKIDGIRFDYAKSDKVTLLGFAGAYPLRGSRSIDTDYPVLRRSSKELGRTPPIAAGFGAAYRTPLAYGSLGGGAIAPLKGEKPRIFVTSTGYYRTGPKLDLYHFGLIDVVSEGGFAINNLSGGLNYRPSPALRATASINHVDTETLEVQARVFLDPNDAARLRNDDEVRRISSTQAQGGLSVGLGKTQQVEISVAVNGRYRPEVAIEYGGANPYVFKEARSVDVLGQIVHRDLFNSRIGVDVIRSFSIGQTSARSSFLTLRGFVSREFRQGRGSWEADLAYSTTKDEVAPAQVFNPAMPLVDPTIDFGRSNASTIQGNGSVYYRLRTSWFLLGNLGVGRFSLKSVVPVPGMDAPQTQNDPGVLSISVFGRIAYRF